MKKEQNNQYLKVLQMRNNELSLLHQKLAVGSTDINNFETDLENAASRLIDELEMNGCKIELELSGEKLTTFKGNDKCRNCTDFISNDTLKPNHFSFPIETNKRKIGEINGCF
ncbi:hypothetical protein KHA80_06115 [Anaerobacillus sp. HL2]|nr:hypothetical protein KHA80_06115 [Anaerobacillus sp. HL2]